MACNFTVTNLVGLDRRVFSRNAVAVQDCLRDQFNFYVNLSDNFFLELPSELSIKDTSIIF